MKRGSVNMKAGLDKTTIIEAAADIADERGIANVTLKVISQPGIRDCLKLCNGTICISQKNIYKRHKVWCLFFSSP